MRPRSRATHTSYKVMPNLAKVHAVSTYNAIVNAQLAPMLVQKPTPARSMAGRTKNIGSEGRTYQNVDSA